MKLLIIVLAPKWCIILQGYFSVVSNALFQDEISQCDTYLYCVSQGGQGKKAVLSRLEAGLLTRGLYCKNMS